ncbi:hypothetical protein MTR67_022761 [Solanum verrucosum]|uniref:THO complex subunit 2 n=1 Tax=Solanum verrucosum TaxID=315347 RepID=A0AAF0TR19_SOLVR|nr:hypothetical protein MTR67_022761 [Solanum verrucosum]
MENCYRVLSDIRCPPKWKTGDRMSLWQSQISAHSFAILQMRDHICLPKAKWLVESALVPLRFFQERCEEEFLWESEMIKIKAADLKSKEVRVNTRLLYQQTKFNLLREESEGYAKLNLEQQGEHSETETELWLYDFHGGCYRSLPNSRKLKNKGLSIVFKVTLLCQIPEGSSQNSSAATVGIIKSLIGHFDLDPNRVFDIVLECFERQPSNSIFLDLIPIFPKSHASQILGFKFQYYQRLEVNDPVPSELYQLTALLVKRDFIDVDSIYAHLLPKEEDAFDHYNAFSAKRLDEANKIGRINLAATGKDLMDEEKQGDVTVDLYAALDMETEAVAERSSELENSQPLGLLMGFLEVDDWYHAHVLFGRLSHLNPAEHVQICDGLFRGDRVEEPYEVGKDLDCKRWKKHAERGVNLVRRSQEPLLDMGENNGSLYTNPFGERVDDSFGCAHVTSLMKDSVLGLSKRLENMNEELSGPVDYSLAGHTHLNDLGPKCFMPKAAAFKTAPLVDEPFTERVNLTVGNVTKESFFSSFSYGDETRELIIKGSSAIHMQKGEANVMVGATITLEISSSEFDMADTGGNKENTVDPSQSQLIPLEEPTPIQYDSSECIKEVEAGATWAQDNIIKLSKQFGTLFDGLEKDAEVLFQKLDQRRGIPMVCNNDTQLVPKELQILYLMLIEKSISGPNDLVCKMQLLGSLSGVVTDNSMEVANSSSSRSYINLRKEFFEMLSSVGPHLYRDMLLLQKVCRVLRGYYICAHELVTSGETCFISQTVTIGDRTPQMHLKDATSRIVEALGGCLLPSLQLIPANPAVGLEIWELMSLLPYELRYRLYGEWEKDDEQFPMLLAARQTAKLDTRRILKRLAKENLKQLGRMVAKLAHANPMTVLRTIVHQIEAYRDMITPVVDAFKYLTQGTKVGFISGIQIPYKRPHIAADCAEVTEFVYHGHASCLASSLLRNHLEYDILEYVVIERLAQSGREKLKDDGLNLSDWLQSLASFWGHLYVLFLLAIHFGVFFQCLKYVNCSKLKRVVGNFF